jgi:hypothetical protein
MNDTSAALPVYSLRGWLPGKRRNFVVVVAVARARSRGLRLVRACAARGVGEQRTQRRSADPAILACVNFATTKLVVRVYLHEESVASQEVTGQI